MRLKSFLTWIATLSAIASFSPAADESGVQFFENKVRPLLVEQCYKCHSAESKKLKGNFYVDSREGILKGGDSGPAVVPMQPDHSKLIEAVSWSNVDLQMPPKQKLSAQQVSDLTQWVKMGAPWPASSAVGPVAKARVFDLEQRKASHWCWSPIRRPALPEVKNRAWVQSPIDRFILARLEQQKLEPSGPADRAVLIRRATFDLTGLPPTPSEIEAFINDASPNAFEKVVDRLLASDHFGERWARHWMDLVRYAETRGHEFEPLIPNAWQYRDYLVRAFNADVPYDQLVTEHMAGDLLTSPRLNPAARFNESVLGTGFWFLGEEVHSPVDIRQDEADRMNNRVDTMTKAFLALTVGCARCHDHKFDAISQKDFYALNGFVLSAGYHQAPFGSMEQNRKIAEQLESLRADARSKLLAELIAAEKPGLTQVSDYLMASRSVMNAREDSTKSVEITSRFSIDPAILHEWVQELKKAGKDINHPLHAFAIAANNKSDDPGQFAATVQQERTGEPSQKNSEPTPGQTVIDYGAATSKVPWYTDGPAFGLKPVKAGQLVLGQTLDQPILGIATHGMARHDFAFNGLHPSPGTEPDAGALKSWNRSGQTLRTPKVTLHTGRLWYLVRGAGKAYAVVDSHLILAGPLHGELLHEWHEGKNDPWVWVSHDLSAYAGQRCHVEFSPAGTGVFEISRVIEADAAPAINEPNALLLSAFNHPGVGSVESLAQACSQRVFTEVSERMEAGDLSDEANAHGSAAVADFLVRHPALFVSRESIAQSIVTETETAKNFIQAQAKLAAQVVNESPTAPAMLEGNGVDENLLIRGVAKNTGDVVPRRFLEAIAGKDQKGYSTGGSGRLQLGG